MTDDLVKAVARETRPDLYAEATDPLFVSTEVMREFYQHTIDRHEDLIRRVFTAIEARGLQIVPGEERASPRDERAVTDNGRDAVIEECAKVAHTHREKGPWCGKELVVWRRACAQVEDAIRALSKDRGDSTPNSKTPNPGEGA